MASGRSKETTFGNTARVLVMVDTILEGLTFERLVSGDDALIMISEEHADEAIRRFKYYTARTASPQVCGIGYIIKSFSVSKDYFSFLSKHGYTSEMTTCIFRKLGRVTAGSHYTTKLRRLQISRAQYNWVVTTGLESQSYGQRDNLEYIQCRKRDLPHHSMARVPFVVWGKNTDDDRWDIMPQYEMRQENPLALTFENSLEFWKNVDQAEENRWAQIRGGCTRVLRRRRNKNNSYKTSMQAAQKDEKPKQSKKQRSKNRLSKANYDKAAVLFEGIDEENGINKEDRGAQKLLRAYADKSDKNHAKILAALDDLKRARRISAKNTTRFAKVKTGQNDLNQIKQWMRDQGYPLPSDRVLWDILALDDWGTVFNLAKPLLASLGSKAFDWVLEKMKGKKRQANGGDEGFNPIDWPSSGTLGPARITLMPGVNVEQRGMTNVEDRSLNIYTVNANAIKSLICPELYKHRYSFTDNQKTAIAVPVTEVPIISSNVANGQVGVMIFPKNYKSNGTSPSSSVVVVYNDATFSVATGTQTNQTSGYTKGPLYDNLTMIATSRIVALAVQFIPTASFNTAGSFTMCHNPRSASQPTNTDMLLTLSTAKTMPFVTSFNNKTTARMLALFQDPGDDLLTPIEANTQSNFIALFGSGLPQNTEVGRIVISYVVEYVPSPAYFHMCVIDYPTTGPSTESYEGIIMSHYPVLQSLDLVDAKKVCDAIPAGTLS